MEDKRVLLHRSLIRVQGKLHRLSKAHLEKISSFRRGIRYYQEFGRRSLDLKRIEPADVEG